MILTERTINIIDHESIMDSPVVLYRGDKNVELKLNIKASRFKFRDDMSSNFIESAQASYGQLIIQTPNQNEPIFSEITATKKGYIIFVITAEMIDEIDEVGNYTFQVRLLDSNKRSRATIPPVVNGIEIREPITSEDSNTLNSAVVGLASAANEEVLDTFDTNGDYAKTNWKFGDKITAAKLNKAENGIYQSYALGLNNNSQLGYKADKTTTDKIQQQINNLVLGAVGDGNNAEVLQARGGYATLNDRISYGENKNNTLFKKIEHDTITSTLPFTHDTSNQSVWLHDNFYLKNTKWADYTNVLVAIEISVTGLTNDMFLDSITTAGKYETTSTVSNNYRLFVENKKITEGEKFIHISGFKIDPNAIAEHSDSKLMFVQYGNSNNIGNPTVTIHNIVIYKSRLSDCSDALDLFNRYGFNDYVKCIDYDKDLINKPAINGIELSKDTTIDDLKEPIGDVIDNELSATKTLTYRNYMKQYDLTGLNFSRIDDGNNSIIKTIENGCPRFKYATVKSGGNIYLYSNSFSIPNYEYIANHTYLFAVQLHINDYITDNETSTAGNVTVNYLAPTTNPYKTSPIYSTYDFIQNIATVGADCNMISYATIDEKKLASATSKNAFNLQFVFTKPGIVIDFTVKNVAVLDVTELNLQTTNQMFERFNQYEYIKDDIYDKLYNIKVTQALNASPGDEPTVNNKPNIEIWGDSLVAQGYGKYIGEYLDRNVLTKGYGGKTSTYIRDKFLAEADTSKTIIINVGRNNYNQPDVVIQDIRAMVSAIPHNNFLICCPPNGHYGEGIGTGAYKNFELIEKRLSRQYGANFLNTRVGTIEEYDMGNVKLINSFVQPEINGQVTITVSDASFLVSYNSGDTNKWGEDFMKKIVIGQSIYAVDVYRVDSYNTSANTLTITLLENNSGVWPGATVKNGVDGGGLDSLKYLRVLQHADYYCFMNDITQSTFRMDGIHMTEKGRKCLAKVVARKINSMNI